MLQLQPPSADFMIEEQEIGDRERRSNLTILGTQPSDAGAYACVAVNEPGSVMQQATLTVHGESDFEHYQCVYVYTVSDYVCFILLDIQWFRLSPSLRMVWCTLSMRLTQ